MPNKERKNANNEGGADEVQEAFDKANEQGFFGVEVDQTPNRNYTVQGVVEGKQTPETDPALQAQVEGALQGEAVKEESEK